MIGLPGEILRKLLESVPAACRGMMGGGSALTAAGSRRTMYHSTEAGCCTEVFETDYLSFNILFKLDEGQGSRWSCFSEICRESEPRELAHAGKDLDELTKIHQANVEDIDKDMFINCSQCLLS